MTLKAELPVFPEGGIYPPLSRKTKIPPGRQILANTPPWKFWSFPLPGNYKGVEGVRPLRRYRSRMAHFIRGYMFLYGSMLKPA